MIDRFLAQTSIQYNTIVIFDIDIDTIEIWYWYWYLPHEAVFVDIYPMKLIEPVFMDIDINPWGS